MNFKHVYLIILFFLFCGFVSCKKMDGYYDYQNQEKVFTGTILEYLESKPGVFDSLLVVLDRLDDLKQALKTDEVTLFAPTNASFQSAVLNLNLVRKNQNKALLELATADLMELDSMVTKYFVSELAPTDSMNYVDGLFLTSFYPEHTMHAQKEKREASGVLEAGAEVVLFSDTRQSNFVADWARAATQAVNIRADNGYIHILDSPHEFGFGEFLVRINK